MANNKLEEGAINFREAHAYKQRLVAIGLWQRVKVQKRMFVAGYEVVTSMSDGSYERRYKYKESIEELIEIHTQG